MIGACKHFNWNHYLEVISFCHWSLQTNSMHFSKQTIQQQQQRKYKYLCMIGCFFSAYLSKTHWIASFRCRLFTIKIFQIIRKGAVEMSALLVYWLEDRRALWIIMVMQVNMRKSTVWDCVHGHLACYGCICGEYICYVNRLFSPFTLKLWI